MDPEPVVVVLLPPSVPVELSDPVCGPDIVLINFCLYSYYE